MKTLTLKIGMMASAIIVVLFMGGLNMAKADGCDNYNGPISLHADPDRFYPVNPAYADNDDSNCDQNESYNERDRNNEVVRRIDYREEHEYDSDRQHSSDEQLASRIRRALRHERITAADADAIGIDVRNGVVTLRGSVETPNERHHIVAKAQHIAGEDNVNNRLSVLPQ